MNTVDLLLVSPLVIATACLFAHVMWTVIGIGLPPLKREVVIKSVRRVEIAPRGASTYHARRFRSLFGHPHSAGAAASPTHDASISQARF